MHVPCCTQGLLSEAFHSLCRLPEALDRVAYMPLPSQAAALPGTLLPGQPSVRWTNAGTQPTVGGAAPGAAVAPNSTRGGGSRLGHTSTAGCSPSPDVSPVHEHQLGRESPGRKSAGEISCSKSPEGSLDPIPSTSAALNSSDSGLWGSPSDQLGLRPGETPPARACLVLSSKRQMNAAAPDHSWSHLH